MDRVFYETYIIVAHDDDDDGHDVDKNGEDLMKVMKRITYILDCKCWNDEDIYHPVDRAPSEK